MRTLLNKKLFTLLITVLIFFSIANAQNTIKQETSSTAITINPSPVLQVQKADPVQMKSMLERNFLQQNASGKTQGKQFLKSMMRKNSSSAGENLAVENYPAEKITTHPSPPRLETNFEGNPLTPFYLPPVGYYASECGIAVSNAGKIVSISNGWIRYYNERGNLLFSDSLYRFCSGLIDVRAAYDPKRDRFIFSSIYGYTNFDTVFNAYGIVVAFSKTNNPLDGWNFYYLPDSLYNHNGTSDYPQLGISDDEVFITELVDNPHGNVTHSSIFQLDKNDGYGGASALNMQHYKVPLSSITQGAIEPAAGGSTTYGPNMYFVMADETGNKADSFFVMEVTNTIASKKAVFNIYPVVHSNLSYKSPPLSYQPGQIPLNDIQGDFLQSAFYENGLIQFSQNDGIKHKAAVYLGRIKGIPNNLSCVAQVINDTALDLSYPQIVYTGNSSTDNSAIVGLEYTGLQKYPGLSAVYVNSNFEVSSPITVKAGRDTINGLWGDYSGICRRYNNPGECWMEGQYGSTIFPNINWIAKLKALGCSSLQAENIEEVKSIVLPDKTLTVFPNPVSGSATISFSLSQSLKVSINIFDTNGRLIKTLIDEQMQSGTHQLTWNARDEKGTAVAAGIYILKLHAGNYSETKMISIIK